ncbi:MAG: hypothetical protein KF684_04615 [Phycisphaeraceae bacterium]|nr:hypothetical protein [Phycisphaeraceae bacterium]
MKTRTHAGEVVSLCAGASAVVAVAIIAPLAHAGTIVRGFTWVEVDNQGVSDGSGADLTGYRTFDLYFNLGSSGAVVTGFNMGFAPNPAIDDPQPFIETDGVVFNHAFGGDTPPLPAVIDLFPALAFDTRLEFGGEDILVVPNSIDLTGDNNGELRGVWLPLGGFQVDPGDSIHALRITLTDFTYLRGMIQVGLGSAGVPYFEVPNIPSPAGAAVLITGALLLGRRRA